MAASTNPEEHAAGVAHEDRRRVEVVEQEPDDRARQRRREQHHQRVAALERDQERRDDGDQRDAARQPVEAVDQVHRVDDADDPEHREREAGPAERDRLAERVRQRVEAKAQPVQQPGHRELHRRTSSRRWRRAGRRRGRAAAMAIPPTNRPMTWSRSATNISPTPVWKQQQPDQRRVERDDDGDAAQAGDRLAVDLSRRPRVVEGAEAVRQPADERRQHRPHSIERMKATAAVLIGRGRVHYAICRVEYCVSSGSERSRP